MAENTTFIVAAFAVTWAVLLGYLWHLARVRAEAERRLRRAHEDLSGGAS